jgi:hypothetical protein
MFKFVVQIYGENASKPLPSCLVISGQPGIGELAIMLVLITSQILRLLGINILTLVRVQVALVLPLKKGYFLFE